MKTNFILKIVAILLLSIVFISCQKEPTAKISASKTTITEGEKITFTSTSDNSDHVKWTFPDGQTSTAKSVDFTFNNSGSKNVLLEAFSKNDKKNDDASLTITVNPALGAVSFWQSGIPAYSATDVTIGSIIKTITLDNPSGVSGCSETGCANFSLAKGTYSYFAAEQGGGATWSGTVTIAGNDCHTIKLN